MRSLDAGGVVAGPRRHRTATARSVHTVRPVVVDEAEAGAAEGSARARNAKNGV